MLEWYRPGAEWTALMDETEGPVARRAAARRDLPRRHERPGAVSNA